MTTRAVPRACAWSELSLRAAALGFALVTASNSVVSIREEVPGEPLGVGVPISVRTSVLTGWGTALASPWPMPAAALLVASRPAGRTGATWRALTCAGIGVAGLVGILLELHTYRPRAWSTARRRAVLAHVASAATLAAAGLWHRRQLAQGNPA